MMNKLTVGIFAHVDAGKTTFSEQLLFQTHTIRTLGRVDHKSAFLDTHAIEKDRGITIFAEQAYFDYAGCRFYLIDTPGHVDFSSEMTRTIEVIDYAIVLISGTDGVQSHTETILELLEMAQVPTVFFINKVDAPHANFDECLAELAVVEPAAVDFSNAFLSKPDMGFLEKVAEKDEALLTAYFPLIEDHAITADSESYENFERLMVQAIAKRRIMPVFKGSALKGEGIDTFLEGLSRFTTLSIKPDEMVGDEKPSGVVYKIRYDHSLQRQTFMKLFSGVLRVRDELKGEKVTEIRLHQGAKYVVVQEVGPGDVFSVIGSKVLQAGDFVGDFSEQRVSKPAPGLAPTMRSKMTFEAGVDIAALFQKVRILEEEDPFLKVSSDMKSREITIGIMGEIQLEVLRTLIQERFGFSVEFEAPQVIYQETIADHIVYGCGHFEPLRHYAEVHVTLEAQETGRGVTFVNACHADDLAMNYVSQVKHCVLDKPHRGLLTGSELTDVRVTLVTGRGHGQHTSTGDFHQATVRAIRHALEQATSILLEPIYQVTITVPNSLVGRVMTDLTSMQGIGITAENKGEMAIIRGRVPVANFRDYATTLASLSSGQGRLRVQPGGYAPCHNQEAVIEAIGYEKERDVDFPSSSVFCQNGKGYTVSWQEALSNMHCTQKVESLKTSETGEKR